MCADCRLYGLSKTQNKTRLHAILEALDLKLRQYDGQHRLPVDWREHTPRDELPAVLGVQSMAYVHACHPKFMLSGPTCSSPAGDRAQIDPMESVASWSLRMMAAPARQSSTAHRQSELHQTPINPSDMYQRSNTQQRLVPSPWGQLGHDVPRHTAQYAAGQSAGPGIPHQHVLHRIKQTVNCPCAGLASRNSPRSISHVVSRAQTCGPTPRRLIRTLCPGLLKTPNLAPRVTTSWSAAANSLAASRGTVCTGNSMEMR